MALAGAIAAGMAVRQGMDTYVSITIGLGRGRAQTTIWTSDLSHEYVTINAEYRS